jgi:hypothetical protein
MRTGDYTDYLHGLDDPAWLNANSQGGALFPAAISYPRPRLTDFFFRL